MKHALLAASMILLAGCAETAAGTSVADPSPRELTREAALAAAKQDALARYQMGGFTTAMASRAGRFWVIDLRTPEGAGMHYAIGADGTIRERQVLR